MDSRDQVRSRVEWSATQNIENNTSTITVDVYTYFQYAIYANVSADVIVDIGGQKSTVSRVIGSHPNGVNKRVARVTKTVKHNNDGTLRVRIKVTNPFRVTYAGQYLNNANHDFTITLNTIPRQSELTSVSNFTLPSSTGPTINIKSHVSSFRHNADLKVNGVFITNLRRVAAGTHTFNLTSAEQNKILNLMSNTTSTKFEVVLGTYSGDTFIGKTQTKTATVSVSGSVVPVINSVTQSEANNELKDKGLSVYIQNQSRVRIQTKATGMHGARIKEIKVTAPGKIYYGSDITTDVVNVSNPNQVPFSAQIEVTDTRNRKTVHNITRDVSRYSVPIIDINDGIYRESWDSDLGKYVPDQVDGTRLHFDVRVTVPYLKGNNDDVMASAVLRDDANDGWIQFGDFYMDPYRYDYSIDNENDILWFRISVPFPPEISTLYSYQIAVEITDKISTTRYIYTVPSGFAILDFHNSGKGIAVGKVSEKPNTFEVALNAEFSGSVNTKDSITISTGTQNPTDNTLLRFRRKDGTRHSAFMYNETDQALYLHLYSRTGWKSYFTFKDDGTFLAGGKSVDFSVAKPIGNNSNLNDFKEGGSRYVLSNRNAGTIMNTPVASTAFLLEVINFGGNVKQTFTVYNNSAMYTRTYYAYGNSWSAWKKIY